MAFLISCCMVLFLNTMANTMKIEFTEDNIKSAAIITFLNVVFLSLICTAIDSLRRKFTVDRHVKKIVSAAERIAKGDYSVRIKPLGGLNRADGLDEIVECFNKMAEELSSVETLQSDFIQNVSHELKTPLAVMQNCGNLLSSSNLSDEERIGYAKSVTNASKRLADLVSNILKLSKLENSLIFPASSVYDLGEQLIECFLSFEKVRDEKEIEVEADIEENIKVNADPELLSIVWNNLISNALKFTEKGGKVSLYLTSNENYATVTIKDTGCGISPEVGKHIFEKFYQGDSSHSTEGNGLGLALVKRVIDIIRGEIKVESTPGIGSEFTVKIRRYQDECQENN